MAAEAARRAHTGLAVFSGEAAGGSAPPPVLTADIEAAISAGQFDLVYQPKVHVAKPALAGVEALCAGGTDGWGHCPPRRLFPSPSSPDPSRR